VSAAKGSRQTPQEPTTVSCGMSIKDLRDEARTNLGIKEKGGVQVVDVDPDSFADDVGLMAGDVILAINRQPIASTEDLKKVQATLKPGDAVAFHVLRKPGGRGEWQSSYLAGTLSTNSR
jgi:serine protease Do